MLDWLRAARQEPAGGSCASSFKAQGGEHALGPCRFDHPAFLFSTSSTNTTTNTTAVARRLGGFVLVVFILLVVVFLFLLVLVVVVVGCAMGAAEPGRY